MRHGGLIEHPLGSAGIERVRRGLKGTALGELVLAQYVLDRGTASAIVPAELPDRDLGQFEAGGILEPLEDRHTVYVPQPDGSTSRLVPVPNTDLYVVSTLLTFLRASPTHTCIFEDLIWRPGERVEQIAGELAIVIDEALFRVLASGNADDVTVRKTLQGVHLINMTLGVCGSLSLPAEEKRGFGWPVPNCWV